MRAPFLALRDAYLYLDNISLTMKGRTYAVAGKVSLDCKRRCKNPSVKRPGSAVAPE